MLHIEIHALLFTHPSRYQNILLTEFQLVHITYKTPYTHNTLLLVCEKWQPLLRYFKRDLFNRYFYLVQITFTCLGDLPLSCSCFLSQFDGAHLYVDMNLKGSAENEDKLMSRMCTSCCVSLRDNRKIRFVWLCRCVRIDISKYVLLRADDESRETIRAENQRRDSLVGSK